jgi:hypothetical protein
MSSDKCETCGERIYDWEWREHKCKPLYEVIVEEDGVEGDGAWDEDYIHEMRGIHHEDAAENYAREYNEDGDYSLMNECVVVRVRLKGELEDKRIVISAEPDVYYSSQEVNNRFSKKDIGKWVRYTPSYGKSKKGIIKNVNEKWVFVVYDVDDNWDKYMDYTGCATGPEDLRFCDKDD